MTSTVVGFLVARLVGAKIKESIARPLVIGVLILLVVGAVLGGTRLAINAWKRSVVAEERANTERREGAIVNRNRAAADAADAAESNAAQARDQRLEGAIENAVQSHPQGSQRPAGPAVTGVLDELRRPR